MSTLHVETNVGPDDSKMKKFTKKEAGFPDLRRKSGQGTSPPDAVSRSCLTRPHFCPRAHAHAKMRQPPEQCAKQLPLCRRLPRLPWCVVCCGTASRLSCVFGFQICTNTPLNIMTKNMLTFSAASASIFVSTIHTVWRK